MVSYESGFSVQHCQHLTPHMKLHYLLQKCSFFLIKLAFFWASGSARMKLQKIQAHLGKS